MSHRHATALAALAAVVVAACSLGGQPPSSAVPSPTSASPGASPRTAVCSVRIVGGPTQRVVELRGEGFARDVTVELSIDGPGGPVVLTETDVAELRTDSRGMLVVPMFPRRIDVGTSTFSVAAGGCTAEATHTLSAEAFPPLCETVDAVTTGGPALDAYRAVVTADAPIAWWSFEEADGPVASAELGGDGTYEGRPVFAQPGIVAGSRSILFDGEDDWIDIPDLRLDGDFTIEAWFFVCGLGIGNRDAIVGQAAEGPDVNLFEERVRLYTGDGDAVIAGVTVPWGRWVHLAITRTDGTLAAWQDGVKVGGGELEPAFPVAAIGWGNAGFLEGRLDEVAIHDRGLPSERLLARIEATRGTG